MVSYARFETLIQAIRWYHDAISFLHFTSDSIDVHSMTEKMIPEIWAFYDEAIELYANEYSGALWDHFQKPSENILMGGGSCTSKFLEIIDLLYDQVDENDFDIVCLDLITRILVYVKKVQFHEKLLGSYML